MPLQNARCDKFFCITIFCIGAVYTGDFESNNAQTIYQMVFNGVPFKDHCCLILDKTKIIYEHVLCYYISHWKIFARYRFTRAERENTSEWEVTTGNWEILVMIWCLQRISAQWKSYHLTGKRIHSIRMDNKKKRKHMY